MKRTTVLYFITLGPITKCDPDSQHEHLPSHVSTGTNVPGQNCFTSGISSEKVVNNLNAPGRYCVLVAWIWSDHRLGYLSWLIHENRRELHPFDTSPVHTCLPPSADKPSEGLAVQFGIRSITPSRDPMIITRGTPGGETSSTPNLLNEVEIHLRVHLLSLCHSLFPASTEQLVMFTRRRFRLETAAKVAVEVEILLNSRFFHLIAQARMC